MCATIASQHGRHAAAIAVLSLALAPLAQAATMYADNSLSSNCSARYDPITRLCSGGTADAYHALSQALTATGPGDTVLVRGGTYAERLMLPRSGVASAPITIKRYGSETPTLSGGSEPVIFLSGRSYIVIEGFTVTDAPGWGRLEDSSHIVIQNNAFVRATATGTTGGLKLVRSAYNKILDNNFEDGNDNVVIQDSDRNLLQGNRFTKARHSLLSIRCGNYNVVRGNDFHNSDQKAVEIYDCEGVSDAPVKLDATKRNLIEANRFTYTRAASESHRYNGIQYAGQNGLVRRNVFYDNQGGALSIQVYSDEALYNYGHRIVHNTFYNNRCFGLSTSSSVSPSRYYDIRVRNNLFYRNVNCNGDAVQTNVGNTAAVILADNALLETAPPFVDESAHDLRLQAHSSQIDTGAFLAVATGAGSGTRLIVDDPGYFYDGYGIPGETGDLIQLAGQTQTARIVAIDHAAKTLILESSLTWSDGQGVHLPYSGRGTDIGAFEYAMPGVAPSPPTLTVSQVW